MEATRARMWPLCLNLLYATLDLVLDCPSGIGLGIDPLAWLLDLLTQLLRLLLWHGFISFDSLAWPLDWIPNPAWPTHESQTWLCIAKARGDCLPSLPSLCASDVMKCDPASEGRVSLCRILSSLQLLSCVPLLQCNVWLKKWRERI